MMSAMVAASRRRVDPDASDYFARAEALGGSFDQTAINAAYTESYTKRAISNMITGLKRDGVWDKITELYLLAGVSFDGLMAKVKHAGTAALTNNNFVVSDYLAAGTGAGLKGGTSRGLSSLSMTTSNDMHLSIYVTARPTNNNSYELGVFASNSGVIIKSEAIGSGSGMWINGTTLFASSVRTPFFLIGVSRGVNNHQTYANGLTYVSSTASASTSTAGTLRLFNAFSTSTARMTMASVGVSLTNADAAALSTHVNSLMTALGCNVY
jgi:hypothetical protein